MEPQHGNNNLPARIRKGHRHNCPGCDYKGKNLFDHLKKKHPNVSERYEKARRGVWVLAEEGGEAGTEGDDTQGEEKGEQEKIESDVVEDLREELREKERRITKLEAYLKEKERRIEDLRETRDKLADISEETLEHIPEREKEGPRIGGDAKADGEKETASKEQAAEQIKLGLSEAFEENVEIEEGQN